MSPDKQVDKQKMVYPYGGILLSLTKIHVTQQMNLKDNTKGQILYDSTSMRCLGRSKSQRESRMMLPGAAGKGVEWKLLFTGYTVALTISEPRALCTSSTISLR